MYVRKAILGCLLGLAAVAAGFGLSSTQAPANDDPPGRKLAFLVGVNEYDHAQMNPLRFPENDVGELAEILSKQQFDVKLLTKASGKKNPNLAPTAQNIQRELADYLKGATRRDLIVVALAGHGIQPLGSERAYFCPRNGNPTTKGGKSQNDPNVAAFPETLISIDETLETLGNSGIGQTVVLVDACRNDPGIRGRRGIDRVRVQALPANTVVLLSCSPGQFAFEHESWGKGGHGAFFSQVIEGLQGAAADEAGNVTYHELSGFLRKRVPALVRRIYGRDGGIQQPNIIVNTSAEPLALATVAKSPLDKAVPSLVPPISTSGSTPSLAVAPFDGEVAKQHQNAWAKHLKVEVETTNTIGMKLRLIPAGEFTMGSPESELSRNKEETQHNVRIKKAFYLGKHEVTRGEFRKFVGATNYKTDAEKGGKGSYKYIEEFKGPGFRQVADLTWQNSDRQTDEHPVVNVSWNDAVEFCNWLSRKERKEYRLPTEAEWEYACRAGTETPFHFGTTSNGQVSNVAGDWPHGTTAKGPSLRRTASVGKYPANHFGLLDMHGNVWEWCHDWYDEKYYATSPVEDPQGPVSAQKSRVLRGGSYETSSSSRSAYRYGYAPDFRFVDFGFRVVGGAPARTR